MPFSLPANFNPGDSYTNTHANNVAAAINAIVNNMASAYVAASEGVTNTTTYTDLTTTTDQVTVTMAKVEQPSSLFRRKLQLIRPAA